MLSHVIPQCLVTDRITIKLQLTGKSRLIFKLYRRKARAVFIECHEAKTKQLLNNKLNKVYFKLNLISTVDQAQEDDLVE